MSTATAASMFSIRLLSFVHYLALITCHLTVHD